MTITLDLQTWLDWIIALPLWIKIATPIATWLVVAIIFHRCGGPYKNEEEHSNATFFCLTWPFFAGLIIVFSPLLLLYGAVHLFGGKIKPKS